jgi:hypothetical protein
MLARRCFIFGLPAFLSALALQTFAVAPRLAYISPVCAQRGTNLSLRFGGERLEDTREIVVYEPGIEITKLDSASNKVVLAHAKIAPDCAIGEHHLRLRTDTGFSELLTFQVTPYPVLAEVEPNGDRAKPQNIPLNVTITGAITNEDTDCFMFEAAKGQLVSAEVQAMRLGRAAFDARLALYASDGSLMADVDDTWLGQQDPYLSFVAPSNGQYVLQLREVTYGGADNFRYCLHVGTFARPDVVYPMGGPAGETVEFTFISAASGSFTQSVKLPSTPETQFGLFPQHENQISPTPNWIRVSPFSNLLAGTNSHDRQHATQANQAPPIALNGIIPQKSGEDWFSFPAEKDVALEVNGFSRKLHSPVDTVVEIYDSAGKQIAANDDNGGADSSLKFTPSASTNYFVRVRDTLGQGGPDFVYRVEVTPATASLGIKIPEVARNDTQSRQFIAVPRGNRFATLISAKRANFSSDLDFSIKDLPEGMTLAADPMPKGVDSMALVFEAAASAPIAGKLVTLSARGSNSMSQVNGEFHHDVELVQGPNNTFFYGTGVDKLAVSVTKEAPFKIKIVEPKVPIVQAGSMRLEIQAERSTNFNEPIELQMVWNPPGLSSQSEATMPKGETNITYQLNATGQAETRTWKIAVLAHAKVEEGLLYVSSQLAPLEVSSPFLSGKMETAWVNPGKPGKLTVSLQQNKPFEGKAKVKLVGLPDKVSAPDKEITKDDQEIVFDLTVDATCPAGSYKNLFCSAEIIKDGQVIQHNIAQGGILRIVPPKKEIPKIAAAATATK